MVILQLAFWSYDCEPYALISCGVRRAVGIGSSVQYGKSAPQLFNLGHLLDILLPAITVLYSTIHFVIFMLTLSTRQELSSRQTATS